MKKKPSNRLLPIRSRDVLDVPVFKPINKRWNLKVFLSVTPPSSPSLLLYYFTAAVLPSLPLSIPLPNFEACIREDFLKTNETITQGSLGP